MNQKWRRFWLQTTIWFVLSIAVGLLIVVSEQKHESGYLALKTAAWLSLVLACAVWNFKKSFQASAKNIALYTVFITALMVVAAGIFVVLSIALIGL